MTIIALFGRNRKRQWAVGINNHATITIGLLDVAIACLDVGYPSSALQQLSIILYGSQIGR